MYYISSSLSSYPHDCLIMVMELKCHQHTIGWKFKNPSLLVDAWFIEKGTISKWQPQEKGKEGQEGCNEDSRPIAITTIIAHQES